MIKTLLLTLALVLLTIPLIAQVAPVQQTSIEGVSPYFDGLAEGTAIGQTKGTSGSVLGGFAGGLFLGVLGTVVAVVAQTDPDIEPEHMVLIAEEPSEYQMGWREGYTSKVKSKKRGSALMGGIFGTAVLVVVVVAASSGGS